MGFSRQEYWSGLPFPSPGNLPNPGTEPRFPALQADALPSEPPGKPLENIHVGYYKNPTKKSLPIDTMKVLVKKRQRCSNTHTQGSPKLTPFSFQDDPKGGLQAKEKFVLTECHITK